MYRADLRGPLAEPPRGPGRVLEPPAPEPQSTEQRVIDCLLAGRAAAPSWLHVDAGDDGAVLVSGDVVTVDALVEGVHFDHRLSPADVGFKSVAVSVSDVIAMGATPTWMVCALSLPRSQDPTDWVSGFARGMAAACQQFGVHLVGGDVTSVPQDGPRYVSNTLAGQVALEHVLLRTGASVGDDLWVTGAVGLAGAGWMFDTPPEAALAALRRPCPPAAFGPALAAARIASAAMDLSDGLSVDLPRLADASGVRVVLDLARLHTPTALKGHPRAHEVQLNGGEDYQLAFTAPPAHRDAITALATSHHTAVQRIGRVEDGQGAILADGSWPGGGFDHFAGGALP